MKEFVTRGLAVVILAAIASLLAACGGAGNGRSPQDGRFDSARFDESTWAN